MELKERLKQVLEGNGGNYIFPFFWQHGEEESVLRDYMRAIREANIREVCVESRPHPDFAGPDWWRDMDIILEEAEKRGMRVWILDDQHFPTGYAAGAVLKADMELTHQYLDHNLLGVAGPAKEMTIDVKAWAKPQPAPPWMPPEPAGLKKWHDDYLFRLLASKVGEEGKDGETVDLTAQVKDGMLTWDVPEGYWKIYVIYLTRDAKGRNDYINFLDKASCRLLIDAVMSRILPVMRNISETSSQAFSVTSRPSETRRVIREATSSESRICLFLGQRRWRRPWIRLTELQTGEGN